jgi:hypothetical protein
LALFDTKVLRNEFSAESFVGQQRKADTTALQSFFEFAQFLPKEMSAELLIELIQRLDIWIREDRGDERGLEHVDQHEVLMPNQVHVTNEAFRNDGVIEGRQKNQERAAPEAKANERANLVEVRSDNLRIKGVERIPAGAIMGFAVFGANECADFVGKGEQTEQVALLFGG